MFAPIYFFDRHIIKESRWVYVFVLLPGYSNAFSFIEVNN